jgi:membrane protein YqaA with SNARE-associated domain
MVRYSTFLATIGVGSWAYSIFFFLRRLGPVGLFLLGALDSSFLFLPFGNDLLLIAMVSANRHSFVWILYVLASAAGSMLGVFLVDVIMRRAGEEGLEKFVKPGRITKLKRNMEKHAGWGVFGATLVPPPFPFTAVVLTASALQSPRRKLLIAVFTGRIVRFTLESILALFFGERLLSYLNSDVLDYFVIGLVVVAIVGSIFSVRKWMQSGSRKSREPETQPAEGS